MWILIDMIDEQRITSVMLRLGSYNIDLPFITIGNTKPPAGGSGELCNWDLQVKTVFYTYKCGLILYGRYLSIQKVATVDKLDVYEARIGFTKDRKLNDLHYYKDLKLNSCHRLYYNIINLILENIG